MLIAQITDTHLFATAEQAMLGCVTAQTLEAVLAKLRQLKPLPDLLLMTGDLSQDETVESYQRLATAIAPLQIPAYWIPGNHDQPLVMASVLATAPISPAKAFVQGGWQFLLLNSAITGQTQGQLSDASLQWLEQQLSQSDRPTIVVLHHPPLPIQSTWMDRIGLVDPEPFLAVLDRHPQVKIVLFGHIHQAFEHKRRGVTYLGSPSTCVQFQPTSDRMAIDEQPPGFRLLDLQPTGDFQTRVERVAGSFATS